MLSPWHRNSLKRQLLGTAGKRGARRRRRRPDRKPAVEQLEERWVPAAWTAIGPAPITNGQTAGGLPVSGRVTGLAADPADANTVYLASAGGGVWKTTNATAATPT